MIGWLTGNVARSILKRLFQLYEARERANNDLERRKIDAEIETLEIQKDAISATRSPGSLTERVMAVLAFLAGLPVVMHLGAVCVDSAFPGAFPGWVVHALPSPMAEWQGAIILSLFGVVAVLRWRR